MQLRNNSGRPLQCNFAILHNKNGNSDDDIADMSVDFFSDPSKTNRVTDFADSLSSEEFHCLPINTNKYVILKHDRFTLSPNPAAPADPGGTPYTTEVGRNYKSLDWWVPLKRNIQYKESFPDGPKTTDAGNVWLVYWIDDFLTNSNMPSVANKLLIQKRILTFFKDPKN
jgi:hypothetical protein